MKEKSKNRAVPGFPENELYDVPVKHPKITIRKCSCGYCIALAVSARLRLVTTPRGGAFHTFTWDEARRAAFNIAGGKK